MKKVISLLLCLVLTLCCFAGCTPGEETPQLQVGYGRASIVPEYSMPLQGYPGASIRWFDNVLDPIYVTAIAFTDKDGGTAILLQYDLADCDNTGIGFGMRDVSEEFGIPNINVMASATHTHSAPLMSDISDNEFLTKEWSDLLREQTVAACREAMESRLPAEVYGATIETFNLNFIRHYMMEDGTIAGDNFGHTSDSGVREVRHMQEVDPDLQLLRFKRQGGKDVVIANFQCHPLRAGGGARLDLTSDYIGPMTTYVEEQLDCHFAYFSGGGGNIDPSSRIRSENITNDHVDQGIALGKYAVLAYSNMQKLDSGSVQVRRDVCNVKGVSGGADSYEIRLGVFSIGDVGFVNVPYEMFCSNGKYIKDNSPFEMTFVTTLAYNANGYVPDAATFAYDVVSYEESKCSYEEGTGEKLAETFVESLTKLHETYTAE